MLAVKLDELRRAPAHPPCGHISRAAPLTGAFVLLRACLASIRGPGKSLPGNRGLLQPTCRVIGFAASTDAQTSSGTPPFTSNKRLPWRSVRYNGVARGKSTQLTRADVGLTDRTRRQPFESLLDCAMIQVEVEEPRVNPVSVWAETALQPPMASRSQASEIRWQGERAVGSRDRRPASARARTFLGLARSLAAAGCACQGVGKGGAALPHRRCFPAAAGVEINGRREGSNGSGEGCWRLRPSGVGLGGVLIAPARL